MSRTLSPELSRTFDPPDASVQRRTREHILAGFPLASVGEERSVAQHVADRSVEAAIRHRDASVEVETIRNRVPFGGYNVIVRAVVGQVPGGNVKITSATHPLPWILEGNRRKKIPPHDGHNGGA